MITKDIKTEVTNCFDVELDNSKRNNYFQIFYSSRRLSVENVEIIFNENLDIDRQFDINITDFDGVRVNIGDAPILIWDLPDEKWLFAYSSTLDGAVRDKISSLDRRVGWMLEVSIDSDIVDDLYHEFSPEDNSVDIHRKWDPYYLYQGSSDIPTELEGYYAENLKDFVDQKIEFNLKTPQWLVDEALEEGVREELINKSGISKTQFTYRAPDRKVRQDGGVNVQNPTSGVTVRQGLQVVHRSGDPFATFDLMDEIGRRDGLYSELEEVTPEREYESKGRGVQSLESYNPGKILKITFEEEPANPESSLKLSNLLTVGQSDVDIHGVIKERNELKFLSESYNSFDNATYEIIFSDVDGRATLFIDVLSGSTAGLVYLVRKLKEKFDPRISLEFVDELPLGEVVH